MRTTSTGSSSRRRHVEPPVGRAPASPAEVEATLEKLGVRPSRRLGQSFLWDPFVADAEAALVAVTPEAPVVEVGGGLGLLTEALLRRPTGPITVVETDPRLAAHLRALFGARVRVVTADALTYRLDGRETVVGNLPFSVATPLLLRFFELRIPRLVVLLQKEVARRLAAEPGGKEYGRLSLVARLYGTPELFRTVPSNAFTPEPEVEGQILVHTRRTGALPVPSVEEFERVVRTLFGQRRKKLANLLPIVTGSRAQAESLASVAGWPDDWKDRRPETLPPEAYFGLARALGAPLGARPSSR
ncbi:MAG: 16S rRNA (adenine(1518)-N(6)/adenine(1519)-N(6))-dimethyltransferase RsmA [Thermoplasmata archaeon]|nr:16S rRNA (adenine(1518)-N(6)/adenine(1519)-N(6))-dimethyltransferase RsmA [Thermoplasmata archaeon]